jgi:hypothetical protein
MAWSLLGTVEKTLKTKIVRCCGRQRGKASKRGLVVLNANMRRDHPGVKKQEYALKTSMLEDGSRKMTSGRGRKKPAKCAQPMVEEVLGETPDEVGEGVGLVKQEREETEEEEIDEESEDEDEQEEQQEEQGAGYVEGGSGEGEDDVDEEDDAYA